MSKEAIYEAFSSILATKQQFAIVTHTNPDGDALGSALALAETLTQAGHDATVLIPNMYPSFLAWMPGLDKALIFESQAQAVRSVLENSTYVFCLDFNGFKRAGSMSDDLAKTKRPFVLIDHHIDPETESFALMYHDLAVSSTSELVYLFLKGLQLDNLINEDVASCLYVGIMTDTGSFSFALKNPDTFRIVADLVQKGIDAERLHRMVYDTFSENRLRLLGHAITNRMMILETYKSAIIALSLHDLNEFNFQIGDTEGIVNYPLSMEKINFAVLITEKKDQIRLSFRSKGSFSVNDFARKHFDGGGHHNAAGGNSYLGMKETISRLLKIIPDYAQDLDYNY